MGGNTGKAMGEIARSKAAKARTVLGHITGAEGKTENVTVSIISSCCLPLPKVCNGHYFFLDIFSL